MVLVSLLVASLTFTTLFSMSLADERRLSADLTMVSVFDITLSCLAWISSIFLTRSLCADSMSALIHSCMYCKTKALSL